MMPALHRCPGSTIQRTFIFGALLLPLLVRADYSTTEPGFARSISGQFLITGSAENSPLANSPITAADTNLVRLEPALLTVSAERLKQSLWRELDFKPNPPWRGQIFLVLHPARSLAEAPAIGAKPFGGGWTYQVQLPDVLSRTDFTRALTGVLLLEFANRKAAARSAEIPAWLADGLSQKMLSAGSPEIILSSPDKIVNGLPVARIDTTERGIDSLAGIRRTLKNSPALTFEQMSWPTDAQVSGADGGAYRASAQLFVGDLLNLKNGAAHLRIMLETLPDGYNWQTAFQNAFRENFPKPLDVEKWWALQVVSFIARDPGPQWTAAVSRDKLDEILSLPVEMRPASNALPVHAEISLQAVIRNFDSARQTAILQTKLRDLELAQFRMAPQLVALTDAYRRAVAGYLGEHRGAAPVAPAGKHSPTMSKKTSASDTLKKLDVLDMRRRTVESAIKPDISIQPGLVPGSF
jgi:hypothetical protein